MMPIALFLAAAINAEPIDIKQSDYAEKAPFGEWKQAYPAAALAKGLAGEATVLCHPASTGWLVDCKVETEEPVGEGFGQAMISMAQRNRLKPAVARRYGPSAWLRYQGSFSEADLNDSPADWLKQPTPDQLNAAWPTKALKAGIGGSATISCKVNLTGAMELCRVESETPQNMDFGAAALLLAPAFRMKPATKDGKPVVSGVRIPINFAKSTGAGPATGSLLPSSSGRMRILTTAPYDHAPSYTEIVAAWPSGLPKTEASGKTAMRCRLRETGLLDDCEFSFASSPRFAGPSRDLAKKFHVNVEGLTRQDLADVYVAVPIQFVSPQQANPKRPVTSAKWLVLPDEERSATFYPVEAVKQGVTSGTGRVQCTVADTGDLIDCKPISETPTNLGFGAAAVQIASTMRMALWGDDGLPTAGATITLPLKINQPEPALAAKQ